VSSRAASLSRARRSSSIRASGRVTSLSTAAGAVPCRICATAVDRPMDGNVVVDGWCGWFGCTQQEQPCVQFIA